MGVAKRAGLLVPGKMERLNKSLLADSGAIFAGSLLGTSSTTGYVRALPACRPVAHRHDGAHRGRAVPGLFVHRSAGRRGAGLRHGARRCSSSPA